MAKKLNIEEPGDTPTPSDPEVAAEAAPQAKAVETIEPPILEAVTPHHTSGPATGPLPDASEIDATQITGMVLSKQGWVLPEAAELQAKG